MLSSVALSTFEKRVTSSPLLLYTMMSDDATPGCRILWVSTINSDVEVVLSKNDFVILPNG